MKTFLQGTTFNWPVEKDGCSMTLFNGYDKIVLEAIGRLIQADAATTAEWKAGEWQYQIVCPDGLVDEGILTIKRNLALAEAGEQTKSHARVMLEAIEAVIEGRATTGQSQISVGDKHIGYMSLHELFMLRDYYKDLVDKEEEKSGPNDGRKILFQWRLR